MRPFPEFDSVLVVGVNTRPIVKSAKALGLRVVAVDCFGDVDLLACADEVFSMRAPAEAGPRRSLQELSLIALEAHEVDAILPTSGTEHDPGFLKKLSERAQVIGNKTSSIQTCEKKEKLFRVADELGIPHPRTERVRGLDRALEKAEEIGYPCVLKPAFGAGGIGIKLARSPGELGRFFERVKSFGNGRDVYVQEHLEGIDASVSVLSNGAEARCLTVNEQIIGDGRLGVPRPFGYCGNVIPLNHELARKIAAQAEALCGEIGLVGSNGVDFVLSDEPNLIEVNPRFQNTIDCIEGLLGINLVEEHIRACDGSLGEYGEPNAYSAKLILYAKEEVTAPDMTRLRGIVDVPREGSTIRRGSPICSVLNFGKSRARVIENAYRMARRVFGILGLRRRTKFSNARRI